MLRRQSRELLERAKRAVEIAIEDGEDAAMAWLLGSEQDGRQKHIAAHTGKGWREQSS